MISVLPDDLQFCMCLSWLRKKCLIININSVYNTCDDTSYRCKNCIDLFPYNDVDEFFICILTSNGIFAGLK